MSLIFRLFFLLNKIISLTKFLVVVTFNLKDLCLFFSHSLTLGYPEQLIIVENFYLNKI